MKKILITLLISLTVGSSFAFIIYKNINKDVQLAIKEENVVIYFQVGVFKKEENAINFMKQYSSSIIIKDNEYYRVIIAIAKSKEAILKLQNYFDNLRINYYMKKESVNNEKFLKKLQEYEELIISSKSETYNTVNKNILKLYESENNK